MRMDLIECNSLLGLCHMFVNTKLFPNEELFESPCLSETCLTSMKIQVPQKIVLLN